MSNPVILAAVALILVHFSTPLAYYFYLKTRWLNKPWNIKKDPGYRPRVSIIVPTYNEAELIESKLDDLARQDYPRELVEVIVIDSASTDGTPEKVEEWARRNPGVKLVLLREPVRRGMVFALNYTLRHISEDTEIVIFTDADSFWDRNTLKTVVEHFADSSVGALTASIEPLEASEASKEAAYRGFYNVVRVAESKMHSTPVHNGALVAYRKSLLDKMGGLPTYTGNNDSTPASLIAFMGYRAIQIDDVVVKEPILKNRLGRKIRRAQHLVIHFVYTKSYAKKIGVYEKGVFDKIWLIESYLHLVNPWILVISVAFLIVSVMFLHTPSIIALFIGLIMLLIKEYRTWIETQLCLVIGSVRNLRTRDIAWRK
ncbi:glycosyltransferase [Thermosphaera sp.]